jgi:hypothetical protein
MPFTWDRDTQPFSGVDRAQPGRFVLRQIDDDTFALGEPIWFTRPKGMRGGVGPAIVLDPRWLQRTDLASIPGYLGWFARRHGRHTPAALLHDVLIPDRSGWPDDLPEDWRLPPDQADLLFRELLIACGVPLVRSHVMWAGVTLRTRMASRPWGRIGLLAWFAAALGGTAVLIYALATLTWWLVAVAVLAPIPAAALWGRQYMAGLTAGYAFWLVVAGSMPAFLAYKVYQGIEWLAWRLRRMRPANRHVVDELPPPVPYDKR